MNPCPAMVLGPRAAGRGYQWLAASREFALGVKEADLLESLPLALAGWADAAEPGFVAWLPLGDGAAPTLLLRARYLGDGGAGSVAFAHALLVDHLLPLEATAAILRAIPEPDGGIAFAHSDFDIGAAVPVTAALRDWTGFGLEWVDRLLVVPRDADVCAIAASIFAAFDPVEQRARVGGWASTAELVPAGSFVPARAFQLLLAADDRAGAGLPHLPAWLTSDRFEGAKVTPPKAWAVWRGLNALAAADTESARAAAALSWSIHNAAMPAEAFAVAAVDAICARLDPQAAGRFITRMVRSEDPAIAASAADQLKRSAAEAPLAAVPILFDAWRTLPAENHFVLEEAEGLLLARADIADLPMSALAPLLVAKGEGAGGLLAAMPLDRRRAIADRLVEDGGWEPDQAELVALLVRSIVDAPWDEESAPYIAAGIGRLLDWTGMVRVREQLLAGSVAAALAHVSGSVAARYAGTLLQLRRAIAERDPLQFEIMGAALTWLRAQEEARG